MTYPTPQGAASPPPYPPATDLGSNLGRIPAAEKVLAAISVVILAGWIVNWLSGVRWPSESLFESIFATLSVLGAFVIALLVILKVFAIRILPAALERHVIAIAALLPLVGYILDLVNPPYDLMKVGGSLALGYVALITYWRKYIPDFATRPVDSEPAAAAATPLPPSVPPAPAHEGGGTAGAPVAFPPPPPVP